MKHKGYIKSDFIRELGLRDKMIEERDKTIEELRSYIRELEELMIEDGNELIRKDIGK